MSITAASNKGTVQLKYLRGNSYGTNMQLTIEEAEYLLRILPGAIADAKQQQPEEKA